MSTIRPALALTLALAAAPGCAIQVASWSGAAASPTRAHVEPMTRRGRWEGRSCRWWVLGIPFGLPHIEEAMADALTRGRGGAMRNLTITSEHTFYGLAGQHCYAVKGDVLG